MDALPTIEKLEMDINVISSGLASSVNQKMGEVSFQGPMFSFLRISTILSIEVVDKFTILNNISLYVELNNHIGKTSAAIVRVAKRVWDNNMLTINTKARVYHSSLLSTLLYESKVWTLYSLQERRLNTPPVLPLQTTGRHLAGLSHKHQRPGRSRRD
jgi:hypothetical protein